MSKPTSPVRVSQELDSLTTQRLSGQASPTMSPSQSPRETRSMTASSSDTSVEERETVIYSLEDLGPKGKLSQTSISLESYILGIILGAGSCSTFYLIFIQPSRLWRPPLFLSLLSLFHFGEFYTYARWNLKNTKADSFLTLSNGRPYIVAMSFAFFETLLTSIFLSKWQSIWAHSWLQALGLILLLTGQIIRDGAIATAGTSFNHLVQKKRNSDHVLITWGPYKWFRHPSYFGFYWWALGTQMLLGNAISTPVFALVLWRFFYKRIPGESTKSSLVDRSRSKLLSVHAFSSRITVMRYRSQEEFAECPTRDDVGALITYSSDRPLIYYLAFS
jgi:protein-S-isoprenylcysteine O-methyltransferase